MCSDLCKNVRFSFIPQRFRFLCSLLFDMTNSREVNANAEAPVDTETSAISNTSEAPADAVVQDRSGSADDAR